MPDDKRDGAVAAISGGVGTGYGARKSWCRHYRRRRARRQARATCPGKSPADNYLHLQ
jgi:hypothetical protein